MMGRWTERATQVAAETKQALELILAQLNHGQRQKLAKNAEVRALLERYGIDINAMG